MVFSVIIPTKNRPDSLVEAIQSVEKQTFKDWELIIIDDASERSTLDAVTPFLSSRVRYLRNERSLGPGAARNRGIQSTDPSCVLISLLDDDDTFYPEFLQKTFDSLYHTASDIGFCWTGIENFYVTTKKCEPFFWDPPFKNKEQAYHGFLQKRLIGTSYGITVKKIVFDKIGYFDESLRAVEDTDFFLRVLQSFFYVKIPDVLVRRTREKTTQVHTDSRDRADALQSIYEKHRRNILENSVAWYNFKAKISSIYYRLGDRKKGRQILAAALRERMSLRIILLWLRLEITAK